MKRKVFSSVIEIPKGIKPIGHKWESVRKRNEKNKVIRYKARLVSQDFSQRPGIDYEETYFPVVNATTLRFLIGLSACKGLQMRLMDVVTSYQVKTSKSSFYKIE